jgi:hypothetical protein
MLFIALGDPCPTDEEHDYQQMQGYRDCERIRKILFVIFL